MSALLQRDGRIRNFETGFRIKSGEIRSGVISAEVIDVSGVRYLLAVTRDITDRKKAEAERKQFIQELDAKNAELERFVYTASHDLKTPLVTIKGFAGLLEKDVASGKVEQVDGHLVRIKSAADKMGRLLQELLDLSRIGRLFNPPEPVALTALAREAVARAAVAERGVAVEVAEAMPVVFGDRERLLEVFQNLVDNAVKFMGDQAKPRITLEARQIDAGAVCSVRDNGIGIARAYHQKIFGLFEQLNGQTEGTGIGLALAKRIVEIHGGQIWVESEGIGHGSTFYLTLPSEQG